MERNLLQHTLPPARQTRALAVLLSACAAVLTLLVLVQAASWLDAQPILGGGGRAHASGGMVSASGDFVVLSGEIGDQDLLINIDNRTESIGVYSLDNNNQPQLLQQLSLQRIFVEAGTRGPGRR